MKTKGIGPQGLGLQGNNGYYIGSPAKQQKKGMNTAERKVQHMKSVFDNQDKEQINASAEDHVKVMASRGYSNTPINERSKQAQWYANYNERKREKNIYKPAREKASKQFDKATRYDDMLGRASSPFKLKDACYKKVKASYDVFPSAYASGAIAKCRKNK